MLKSLKPLRPGQGACEISHRRGPGAESPGGGRGDEASRKILTFSGASNDVTGLTEMREPTARK